MSEDFIKNRSKPHLPRALFVFVIILFGLVGVLPFANENPTIPDATTVELEALEQELREAETVFAASFAEGDMEAFANFLDQHAIFMGSNKPLRGKEQIVERWTRMRGTEEAPFSWRPERVAVEASGQFGMSTGPVSNRDGKWVSSFVSTWKRTDEGWRIILDVGPKCPPPPSSESSEE